MRLRYCDGEAGSQAIIVMPCGGGRAVMKQDARRPESVGRVSWDRGKGSMRCTEA